MNDFAGSLGVVVLATVIIWSLKSRFQRKENDVVVSNDTKPNSTHDRYSRITRAQIRYVDEEGVETVRIIQIKRIKRRYNDFLLLGWCEMRQAYRSFLASRIKEFVDLETGEVITDTRGYIEKCWFSSRVRAG